MITEKCFAMRINGECSALTVKECRGYGRCAFYKPVWMHQRDHERIDVRLCALPQNRQQEIADQYHNGKMPWKGDHE